jgi:hypothetical protein
MKAGAKYCISVIVCCVLGMGVKAGSNLGLGVTTLSKDTLYYGDTLYINTYLVNHDLVDYNDNIGFGIKINDIVNVNRSLFPNPYTNLGITIPAGDSIPLQLSVLITPAYLEVGPDILVVWPMAGDGSAAYNNLSKQIVVLEPLGINDGGNGGPVHVFYINERVFIRNMEPENGINRVRIYDLEGRLLTEQVPDSGSVPFDHQQRGIYLIEVLCTDGTRRVAKLMVY